MMMTGEGRRGKREGEDADRHGEGGMGRDGGREGVI
jgi:hypothetical protein